MSQKVRAKLCLPASASEFQIEPFTYYSAEALQKLKREFCDKSFEMEVPDDFLNQKSFSMSAVVEPSHGD